MAVDALQLRPRGAVALFDAAIRACATSAGVWALTLPTGAAVVAALFSVVDAARHGRPVGWPVGLLTLAWLARALAQGAACHHLEQQLLGPAEPSLWGSVRAALARAPGLVTASVVMLAVDLALWVFTAGVGLLFVGAQQAGYATIMRGQGSALRVLGTSARLLGPARRTAPWVRLCGLGQVVLAVNLQLAVLAGLYLARALFGFEVAFLVRLTSPADPGWLAVLAATTFALFEPVRAATGTLLLVDGRVRQEGLDLLAQVEQLPRRARPRGAGAAAALAVLLLACPALAGPRRAELLDRLQGVAHHCGLDPALDPASQLEEDALPALERFVERLETEWEDEDCQAVEAGLVAGLRAMGAPGAGPDPAVDPATVAREVLARPEFQQAPAAEATAPAPEGESWWDRLVRRLLEWLRRLAEADRRSPRRPEGGDPMTAASAVLVLAVAAVVAVLVMLLARLWSARRTPEVAPDAAGPLEEAPLGADPASALSRPPRGWAELADQLAARGDFREAIRHLYLALLARLHREGVITYEPSQSNWEYLRAFRGPAGDRLVFRELTSRFDYAWYGRQDGGPAEWARFRQAARPLLERPEVPDA